MKERKFLQVIINVSILWTKNRPMIKCRLKLKNNNHEHIAHGFMCDFVDDWKFSLMKH